MAIPQFGYDVEVIEKLADRPNDTNGLSAAALKAKFDEAVKEIKTYINSTLLPFLQSSAAADEVGVDDTILSMGVSNIQDALEVLQASITSGTVPDGGITTAKIGDEQVTAAKLDPALTYAAVNLTADQVIPIFIQANDPTTGDDDGIYLVTGS